MVGYIKAEHVNLIGAENKKKVKSTCLKNNGLHVNLHVTYSIAAKIKIYEFILSRLKDSSNF